MTASSDLVSEEHLQCSICLDVFTDPVSTPCGHNFCKTCLKECWDNSSHCQCPFCKHTFDKRPELHVNTFISELAAQFKTLGHLKSDSTTEQLGFMGTKVRCDCCAGEKLEAVKSCLDCGVSYCHAHLLPHRSAAQLKRHKLMDAVENLKDYICQKHERPLELFCRDDQMCVCQFCTEGDHKSHSTVPIEEDYQAIKFQLERRRAEVQMVIQDRMRKSEETKHSLTLHKDKAGSIEVFDKLMHCVKGNQAKLLEMMKKKHSAAERHAEEFIKELEDEITELKRSDTALEQLLRTDDHLHFLQRYSTMHILKITSNRTDFRINPEIVEETLMRMLSELQEYLNKEVDKLAEIKLKKIQQYAVDVTLDPATVHPYLILSDDRKQVTCGHWMQNYSDNPERFNHCPCVLGKEGFSSGRSYYQVQVKGKTMWDLGVARESIIRKGKITACPENGFWSVCLRQETDYQACESRWISLSLKQKPEKIGVFVDYEEGLVSFYDVKAKTFIYAFTDQCFTEKLYPYFSPCLNDKGQNSAPLIILPIKHNTGKV